MPSASINWYQLSKYFLSFLSFARNWNNYGLISLAFEFIEMHMKIKSFWNQIWVKTCNCKSRFESIFGFLKFKLLSFA